ncbi:hypothetical protein FQN51_004551 [Onygenales sp. PD_10]|nr:hypothetical protein FQN51_004551 [Onygenales sp. PD_10]
MTREKANLDTLGSTKERFDIEGPSTNHPLMDHSEPDVVNFEGPEDPENPMNWHRWRKGLTIVALCGLRLVTIIYHVGNFLFTAFTIGCALAQNVETLIACRVLAGLCGGATMTNPGGTIADMIAVGRRGAVLSLLGGVDVISPVLGPSAGGYIASAWGWRWMFWFLGILSGVFGIFSLFVLRETFAPVILERKAERLRKSTGNMDLRARGQTTKPLGVLLTRAFLRPLHILMFSPIILALSLYMSLVYGIIYILFTTISIVFQGEYGFDTGNTGLTFLGFATGMVLALMVAGYFNDNIHKKLSQKHHEDKPEFVARSPQYLLGFQGLFLSR